MNNAEPKNMPSKSNQNGTIKLVKSNEQSNDSDPPVFVILAKDNSKSTK